MSQNERINKTKVAFFIILTIAITVSFALPFFITALRENSILGNTDSVPIKKDPITIISDPAGRLSLLSGQFTGNGSVTLTEQKNVLSSEDIIYILSQCLEELDTLSKLGLFPKTNTSLPVLSSSCDISVFTDRETGAVVSLNKIKFSTEQGAYEIWLDSFNHKIYSLVFLLASDYPGSESIKNFSFPSSTDSTKIWCEYLGTDFGRTGNRVDSFVVDISGTVFVFEANETKTSIIISGSELEY